MACWRGAQGQVTPAKNSKIFPNFDVIDKKTEIQNSPTTLQVKTRRLSIYLEGSNSSLALSSGELCPEM